MKLAIMLLCHKQPEQINYLLDALDHEDIDCFVHMDKKAISLASQITRRSNVIIVPHEKSVDVQWGRYSQVEAILELLQTAHSHGKYDAFWLCSGQDFPIISAKEIVAFFDENRGCNFVNIFDFEKDNKWHGRHYYKRNELVYPQWMISKKTFQRVLKRLYIEVTGGYEHTVNMFKRKNSTGFEWSFGATWWSVSSALAGWMLDYISNHPEYEEFFRHAVCPDESFFQTLVMNSPYKDKVSDYLHYVDWSNGESSPKTLTADDYEKIKSSGCLMARKIDIEADSNLLAKMMNDIKKTN